MNETFPVAITVDAAQRVGDMRPLWRFFGADEPGYASMRDGEKLLSALGELAPRNVYFRAHNLLTSGDGTPALKWGSTKYRIDGAHSNAFTAWKGIGSPPSPTPEQYARLEQAGRLARLTDTLTAASAAVSLIVLDRETATA